MEPNDGDDTRKESSSVRRRGGLQGSPVQSLEREGQGGAAAQGLPQNPAQQSLQPPSSSAGGTDHPAQGSLRRTVSGELKLHTFFQREVVVGRSLGKSRISHLLPWYKEN